MNTINMYKRKYDYNAEKKNSIENKTKQKIKCKQKKKLGWKIMKQNKIKQKVSQNKQSHVLY